MRTATINPQMIMKKFRSTALALVGCLCAGTVSASMLFLDTFDYPAGAQLWNQGQADTQWAGPWQAPPFGDAPMLAQGSLRYPGGGTDNDNRAQNPSSFSGAFRGFANPINLLGNVTYYFSYLVHWERTDPGSYITVTLDSGRGNALDFGIDGVGALTFTSGSGGAIPTGITLDSGVDTLVIVKIAGDTSGNYSASFKAYKKTDTVPAAEPSYDNTMKFTGGFTLNTVEVMFSGGAAASAVDSLLCTTTWEELYVTIPAPAPPSVDIVYEPFAYASAEPLENTGSESGRGWAGTWTPQVSSVGHMTTAPDNGLSFPGGAAGEGGSLNLGYFYQSRGYAVSRLIDSDHTIDLSEPGTTYFSFLLDTSKLSLKAQARFWFGLGANLQVGAHASVPDGVFLAVTIGIISPYNVTIQGGYNRNGVARFDQSLELAFSWADHPLVMIVGKVSCDEHGSIDIYSDYLLAGQAIPGTEPAFRGDFKVPSGIGVLKVVSLDDLTDGPTPADSQIYIDEIRIAKTWQDAVGISDTAKAGARRATGSGNALGNVGGSKRAGATKHAGAGKRNAGAKVNRTPHRSGRHR